MTFGTDWKWGSNKDESMKVFNRFVEMGGNFVDTANFYTNDTSEEYLGEFMQPIRDKIVCATKYSLHTDPNDPNSGGNHRKNLFQTVDKSLKRLKTDYIDVLWLHAWDFMTPIEEVMRSLDDLVRMGKVFYIGISDTPAWIIARGNTLAEFHGWSPCVALQLEYSLVERTIEREFFPMSDALDMAIAAWSPLAMGVLTGKYADGAAKGARGDIEPYWLQKYLSPKNQTIVQAVLKVAREINRTPAQVSLRWIMQKSPRIIPIIGAKTLAQFEDNMKCLEFALSDEHFRLLNEASRIEEGFPHEFLASEGVHKALFGETYDLIINHRR